MSFDGITRTALERATAGIEGARHIGSQLPGYAGTNAQTLLEAIIGRVLPSGGTTGQVLTKSSNTDYAVSFTTPGGAADASETVKGIAELATQGETDTGTDDARIVTPLKLATRTATATRTGVVELATDAETTTGTDTARATTPANVKAALDARFAYYAIPFAFDGTLPASNTGRLKGIVWKTGTITKVFAKVRTAPTTQSILVDLNLNGTTIWSTQGNRVAIAAAGTSGTQTTFNTTAVTEDDYVTCDIDQAGSGTTGADLTVFLVIRYAL